MTYDPTIPVRRRSRLDDTQPVRRVPPPLQPIAYPPYSIPRTAKRRASCLPPLIAVLVVFFCILGGPIAAGYLFLPWAAALPRTNILVLGLDRRPSEGYVVRSDTMMLVTVYPPGPRVALLSIPRDLYVAVPGHGESRINTAHFWGENAAPGGGPALAMETVAQNLGVPVHRYVRVDFAAFRAIVDAIGGIDIVVEQPIVDDAYPTDDYGVTHIEIPAGPQHMDGETALRYARSRHGSSDFERAERQQQIFIALARRLLDPAAWPRLPLVYAAVVDHVDTNLTFWDLLLLAPTCLRVGAEGIERYAITREMTEPLTTDSGAAVLLPRWEAIRPLIQDLFMP